MAQQYYGMPTAAQLQLEMDNLSTVFKTAAPLLGINAPADATGLAALADAARKKVLGDGSTQYGLGNPPLQQRLADPFNQLILSLRYDTIFKNSVRAMIDAINGQIDTYTPSGWNLKSGGVTMSLDAYLLRLNGAHSGVPTTPAAAGTLTATYNSSGALGNVTSGAGNRPYVRHTLIGANDYDESLPSAEATQVDITGGNNAYSYQIAGTVPVGTTKVRVYRGNIGGASGTNYYTKDVSVSSFVGSAYPAILLLEPDSALRVDIQPPSWMQIGIMPEAAGLVAMAYGTRKKADLASVLAMTFLAAGMLSASNVLLNAATGWLGYGNDLQKTSANNWSQSGVFGTSVLTGAATQTWTAGTVQAANDATNGLQGFAGALGNGSTNGLQARVTSATNGSTTLTISYDYYDAAHGWGNTQTQTGISIVCAGTTVGSTGGVSIPAGRVVRAVTVTAKSGASTSGTLVIEGVAPRTY